MLEYDDVISVPVVECGEPMCKLPRDIPTLALDPNPDMIPFTGTDIWVRETVGEKLLGVATHLSKTIEGARLVVVYGYRHPTIQQRYFNAALERVKSEAPLLSNAELVRIANRFAAAPEVAGHPSGGAVDVTMEIQGVRADLGSHISHMAPAELIPTFSPLVSEEARRLRMTLREAMMSVGFAPFDGEWWHFSYGDREWAKYYGAATALYDVAAVNS